MSQQNIDFGTFPDDPDADAIRTAFAKVQNNFTELFATTTAGSVVSINGGAGIAVNTPTGNVIVTANLAQVVVSTSSLSVGQGSNGGTTAVINSSINTLVIDINPANVFSGNFSGVSSALANLNGTLTTNSNSQPNITSVGTLTSLSVTGNISSGNANLGNLSISNYVTGTLTTVAQPNITSVGTLTTLAVTGNSNLGNIASANFFSGDGYLLSNLTVSAGSTIVSGSSNVKVELNGNVNTTAAGNANIVVVTGSGSNINGYLTVTGNVSSGNANLGNNVTANYFIGNLYGNANTAGTVTTNAQPNITSVGTVTSLTVTGNITSGNVYANSGIIKAQYLQGDGSNLTNLSAGVTLVNGNSNVNISTANGNINMSAVGNSNVVVVTGTGVNVAGTINATGTITGNLSGNVITTSQGNITSLGTLTGLTVNGTANLGAVGNVKITGSAGFLQSDGSGNLSFSSPITQIISGSANTVLLSSGSNTIIASGNIKFNDPQLDITGTLSVTGNANVGNLNATLLTGTLTTNNQTNIKQVGTLDYLIINTTGSLGMGSGNITAGNINLIAAGSANLGNSATANYFIGSGNNLSNIQGSNVTGAVTSATSATNASALLQNTSSATTVYPTFTTSSANGNSSAVINTSISANLGNASITATTFVGALNGAATSATSATTAGTVTTAAQTSITSVGTLTSLSVSGQITNANITTGANTTAGNLTGNWTLSTGSRLQATYADLAEKYVADATYTPGTVLIFGGDQEVTLANSFDSTRVAGVVTTNPAYVMNSACEGEHIVNIALQGRVPVKVQGPVYKGDLLVSSTNGHATSNNIARAGTIIGKSLENFNGESGIIEVAVGRF